MSNRDELLQSAVDRKYTPVYMTNYAQIKDYYQDKHGHKGWIGAMAQALSGSSSRAKSDKPYQAARRAVERFETGQNKSMKKYGGKVEGIGRTLPPIGKKLPNNQITVTVKGYQNGRERTWTATFKGTDAYAFADNPTYRAIWEKLQYPSQVIDMFEEYEDIDEDDNYGIDIYSVA